MNLAIDRGNSFAKVGIFEGDKMLEKYIFTTDAAMFEFLDSMVVQHAIISSVSTPATVIQEKLNLSGRCFILNHELNIPVKLNYDTPETLGMDRLAAVCGAFAQFPNMACLVIDCGTCITYDILDTEGNYLGGAISPGIEMKSKALNTFTKRLPLIIPSHAAMTGTSTITSIQSGIVNGTIFEIKGFIDFYKDIFPDLEVLLCGGDTSFFENMLKDPIFVAPDLVLCGLNRILLHNVE